MRVTKLYNTQFKTISYIIGTVLIASLFVLGIGYRDTDAGRYVLVGIIALGIGIIILFRPQLGGYILITTIITNISTLATIQGFPSVNKPLVALVGVSVLSSYLLTQRRRLPKLGSIEWILLLILAIWVASVPGANYKDPAEGKVIELIKNFIIVVSIIYSLQNPRYWKRAVWIAILVTTVLAALGVYQAISGNYAQDFGGLAAISSQEVVEGVIQPRLSGPIRRPNYWAQFMVAVLPLVLYRILYEKKVLVKAVASLAALILVYALLGTYSRGGFVALVAVFIMIILERRARPTLVLLVIISAMLIVALFPANYTERVQSLLILTPDTSLSTLYEDSSFRGRFAELRAGLRMFAEYPILGVGVGNYKFNYQTYARKLNIETRVEVREAHSLYIEILAETGLIGAAAVTVLFGTLLLGLARVRDKMRKQNRFRDWIPWLASIQISITAYLVSSLFLHGDYIRYLWILVALGTAALYLTRTLIETSQPSTSQEGVAI
jgi:putative inorganic carbon (HCO3(-)) transporter